MSDTKLYCLLSEVPFFDLYLHCTHNTSNFYIFYIFAKCPQYKYFCSWIVQSNIHVCQPYHVEWDTLLTVVLCGDVRRSWSQRRRWNKNSVRRSQCCTLSRLKIVVSTVLMSSFVLCEQKLRGKCDC